MKTQILTLAFSLMCLVPNISSASGNINSSDTTKNGGGGEPMAIEEVDLDLDEHFVFLEKVYIHIYDQQDKPLMEGAFTSKEVKENKKLKDLLRKSTRFMSVDRHYYYILNEG